MSENKKTWDEKITQALGELENRIKEQDTESGANFDKRRSYRRNGSGKYRNKKEWKKALFREDVIMQAVKSAAFLLATVALIQGIVKVLPDSITVTNSVNGRELPIYCVETDKKQVALSFDAAWGNEDTAKILEILRNHNVKVTFFMTGGWVDK